MLNRDAGFDTQIEETIADVSGISLQLPGDPRRQAVSSFLGDFYQIWWSIDAWLRLPDNANELIYLEGAEDFDFVGRDAAAAVQIRRTTGTISLGTAKAQTALENYWALSSREAYRKIEFHYLTTSSIAREQDSSFGEFKGIGVWQAARTNTDLAIQISQYLVTKLAVDSPLRLFLMTARPEEIQELLIKKFHWLTDQPDIEAVKRSVDDRIAVLLIQLQQPLSLVSNVRKNLESRFGEILLNKSSDERCLTRAELLRQVSAATIVNVPVPISQLSALINKMRRGYSLLDILLEKSPKPPEPLLNRPVLAQRLEELVDHRKVVLLTGTVFKGKTTSAQLVSSIRCRNAWWVGLSSVEGADIDNLFLALADRIEDRNCPSLIIIDDLDISPSAHRVYRDSLAIVIHRACKEGRSIILTARGASSESAIMQDFENIALLEVPEMGHDEIRELCVEHGCPEEIADAWAFLISTSTSGHPKLVQVRLAELAGKGWQQPGFVDFTTPSAAVVSARQMARHLLSDTTSPPIAEFVYLVSECSTLIDRKVAIKVAESIPGLINAGDVLDGVTGKWIERFEGGWYRGTALLTGAAAEVWSSEKRKRAHIVLHDALRSKKVLSPAEAAALLFHAYIAGEPSRLFHTAYKLQTIHGVQARHEVEKYLFWLVALSLEKEQIITEDPMTEVALRSLQFQVASSLDSDSIPKICDRWKESIEKLEIPEPQNLNKSMMSLFLGAAESTKVPLRHRLDAIKGIQLSSKMVLQELESLSKRFFEEYKEIGEISANCAIVQFIFLNASRSIRDLNGLSGLMLWLDNEATDEIRQQFDAMLEWPLTQMLGAFVQGAWAAVHEQINDWEPWIALFENLESYAARRSSPRFGREAAKARATILTEYLDRAPEALKVLESAEAQFGQSPILAEQRANVFFQTRKDELVLDIWKDLVKNPEWDGTADPYAYRRAGMSAARLKKWDQAQQIFNSGAKVLQQGSMEITRFGLQVDAALCASLGGQQEAAAVLLADAVVTMPAEASLEGDGRWEAVQRVAVMISGLVEKIIWKPEEPKLQYDPGNASSPDLKVSKPQPGQAARSEMTRAQILCLASSVMRDTVKYSKPVESLLKSKYFSARWFAAQAHLSMSYSGGAGHGFIEAIIDFERYTVDFQTRQLAGKSLLEPDEEALVDVPLSPERWFGLLCAGLVCGGLNILQKLQVWLEEASRLSGEQSGLKELIRVISRGASLSPDLLYPTVTNTTALPAERCGAAARLLEGTFIRPENVINLQAFLASALVSDASFARQSLFNLHVARQYATVWNGYRESSYMFYSPGISLPVLFAAIEGIETGRASLKTLLTAAANALRHSLGGFIERVW